MPMSSPQMMRTFGFSAACKIAACGANHVNPTINANGAIGRCELRIVNIPFDSICEQSDRGSQSGPACLSQEANRCASLYEKKALNLSLKVPQYSAGFQKRRRFPFAMIAVAPRMV